MNLNKKNKTYLFIAAVALMLALGLEYGMGHFSNQDRYLQEVQNNLLTEGQIADNIIFEVKQKIHNNLSISFSELNLGNYKYPVFIYREKELIYWSDHRFSIPVFDLEGNYIEKSIEVHNQSALYFLKRSTHQLDNADYSIIAAIPIKQVFQVDKTYLNDHLNQDIFPESQNLIHVTKQKGADEEIIYKGRSYLFSINFDEGFIYQSSFGWVILFFKLVFICFIALFFLNHYYYFLKKECKREALIVLAIMLIWIRATMLFFELPHQMISSEIFASTSFASSLFAPSLGDLVMNILAITFLVYYTFERFTKIFNYRALLQLPERQKKLIAIGGVILSFFSFHFLFTILNTLYFNSTITLDITKEIRFPIIRILSFGIIILVVFIHYLISQLISKLLIRLGKDVFDSTQNFVIGSVVYYLIALIFGFYNLIIVFNIHALYLVLITFVRLPQILQKSNYKILFYLIACATSSAFIGAYSIYQFSQTEEIQNKEKFVDQLFIERDHIGEFYLDELSKQVSNDNLIERLFMGMGTFSRESVKKKIRKVYLNRYLEKYDIDFLFFNGAGAAFDNHPSYQVLFDSINNRDTRTDYSNIFFDSDLKRNSKRYFCFIPIRGEKDKTVGHITLELRQKQVVPNSIHQLFFSNDRYNEIASNNTYSYAIYRNNRLEYSYGEFAYDNVFLDQFQYEGGFLDTEFETENHIHQRFQKRSNQTIIISSEKYPLGKVFANFSFLFLLLVFALLSGYILYKFSYRDYRNISFATKVQLYLNLAFFIPLVVVSLITITILNNTNQNETKIYFLENAQNVGESEDLISKLIAYQRKELNKETLLDEIVSIADFTQTDINLFTPDGELLFTSQSYLFDNNLLAKRINPAALENIVEQKQLRSLLPEAIGSLNYNTAYVGIQSYEKGEIIGIVGVPFFGSTYRFERQIIEVVSTILKIFASIFVVLTLLSYLSAKSLIKPLTLIISKIKATSLSELNAPLEYHSNDELGLLVGAYNKMLVDLETSRNELEKNEKEKAWREMAKQVAHEIKNPLTPMKLTLQQLQRKLVSQNGEMERPLNMLLEQVDILSDIATSFASFAKMPILKDEKIEITSILRRVVTLHSAQNDCEIQADIPHQSYYVLADSQTLFGVFTNLILNGIQAMPAGRKPKIEVAFTDLAPNDKILIEIKDNGKGIPEAIQKKIFLIDFTTKKEGSGIGLAVAKRGIEHAGGNIWFDTEMGQGTSFFIEMPIYEA